MNSAIQQGRVSALQSKRQAQLYQQLTEYSKELNRLADARDVSRNKLCSAPLELLPMVF
jgi:hypothetical protein